MLKRQNFRTPLVVSGILIFSLLTTLTALFFQTVKPETALMKAFPGPKTLFRPPTPVIPPLAGHWLMTGQDKWYSPPRVEINRPGRRRQDFMPQVLELEQARTALNRTTDSINIMYIWTDGDRLNVISVTSFNRKTRQAAIVVVPLHTVTDCGNKVNLQGRHMTVRELYRQKGREGVRSFLRQKLEIDIPNYIHVNQAALRKISDIIGVLNVNGDKTTMLEAFEQTAAGIRTDDPDVVKAVAAQVLKPRMLLEVPRLLWIFTHDIATNFSPEQMLAMFYFSRQMDLGHMRKTALPGLEYVREDGKYLFVSEQTWKNIVYEITS